MTKAQFDAAEFEFAVAAAIVVETGVVEAVLVLLLHVDVTVDFVRAGLV